MLKLMYITNDVDVAMVAEKCGVDRIWIDLEVLGKEERQKGMNTVKSKHTVSDISRVKKNIKKSEILVRINPWNKNSECEINEVIEAGADIIMLPMWKTPMEVVKFVNTVAGRCATVLLLETREAVECLDEAIKIKGIDEVHIGLNDLHLSYGLAFMFETLSNGIVEGICKKLKQANIPYGFGGVAKLGAGLLPAEKIIMEHYRLGSTRAILSRSFYDSTQEMCRERMEAVFMENMEELREFESFAERSTVSELEENKRDISRIVNEIIEHKRGFV